MAVNKLQIHYTRKLKKNVFKHLPILTDNNNVIKHFFSDSIHNACTKNLTKLTR